MKVCFQLLRQMTGYEEIEMLKSLHEGDQTRKRRADSSVVGGPLIPWKLQYYPCRNITAASQGSVHIQPVPGSCSYSDRSRRPCRPLTTKAREQSWDNQCGICGGQSGAGTDFSPSAFVVCNFGS